MKQQNEQTSDFDDVSKKKRSRDDRGKKFFRTILDGSYLGKDSFLNNFPYILLISFLTGLYIANTYRSEQLLRRYKNLENEIRELSTEAISISSQLMQMSNQSAVTKLCKDKNLGLHENIEPPYKIVLKDEDLKKIRSKKFNN